LLLLLSLLIGFWGCTIREQAIAAPVAILIFAFAKHKDSRNINRTFILGVGVILLAIFGYFEMWRMQLPNSDPPQFGLRPNAILVAFGGLVRGWFNLALVTGLAALLVLNFRNLSISVKISMLFTTLLGFAALMYSGIENFFLPNYLSQKGAYADVLPPTTPLFLDQIWLSFILLAIFLGIATTAKLVISFSESRRNFDPLLSLFTFLTLLGTIYQFFSYQGVFDRYFLAFAPFIFMAIFINSNRYLDDKNLALPTFTMRRAILPTLLVMTLSALLALHSWSFDQKRWEIAEQLVERGYAANTINAGLEWQGWHSKQGVVNQGAVSQGEVDSVKYPGWGFDYLFNVSSCQVIATSEIKENWQLIETVPYSNFLYFGEAKLYVYQTDYSGCL
jgi:hypothetical protein